MSLAQAPAGADLSEWNQRFQASSALDIICFASSRFEKSLNLASSFGPEDLVLMHLSLGLEPRPEIFVLDTGRLPPQTYDLIERWRIRYDLTIRFYYPDTPSLESFVTEFGPNAFYENVERRKQCCFHRKVEPLQRALSGKQAWLTGLRREQSPARADTDIFSFDEARRVKISPLVNWTRPAIWAYIKAQQLPYNPLHDQGYTSIGCAPCSRATLAHEDERAGRWWWENQSYKECGLHSQATGEDQHAKASL